MLVNLWPQKFLKVSIPGLGMQMPPFCSWAAAVLAHPQDGNSELFWIHFLLSGAEVVSAALNRDFAAMILY